RYLGGIHVSKLMIEEPIDSLISAFTDIVEVQNQDLLQENANVDGQTTMGQMGKFSSEARKFYAKQLLLPPEVRQAIEENFLHPHDLDFLPTLTTTSCQIPPGSISK